MLITDIVKYAAHTFKVTPEEIMADNRHAKVHRARLALYAGLELRLRRKGVYRRYTPIGNWLGRHHTSVIAGVRRAHEIMAEDEAYAEIVERIAALDQESACKPKLQVLPGETSATPIARSSTVRHPEDLEAQINKTLEERRSPIRVYWDGELIERDTPPVLDIYFGEHETPYFIEDGRSLRIVERVAPRHYREFDRVRYYDDCADALIQMAGEGIISAPEEEEA